MQTLQIRRIVKTVVIILAGVTASLNLGAIVTTFPAMQVRTSSNTAQMSTIFIWFGLGNLVGVMLINPLFDRLNAMFLLSLSALIMGIFVALAPTWTSLAAFIALASLAETETCVIVAGVMSANRDLWKWKEASLAPVIQATNLLATGGFAIGPQVIKPFIGVPTKHVNDSVMDVTVYAPSSDGGLQPIQKGYLLVAALDVGVALFCTIMWVWDCIGNGRSCSIRGMFLIAAEENCDKAEENAAKPDTSSQDESQKLQADEQGTRINPRSRMGIVLLIICVLFILAEEGQSNTYNGVLYTYLNEYLKMSVQLSTLLETMFQVARLVVGAVVVVVSRWISPKWLLIFDVACYIISAILMWAGTGGTTTKEAFTAIGLVVGAMADCNTLPTFIVLVEETIPVVAWIMALFYMTSGVSSMVFGPIAGASLNYSGAVSYPTIVFALGLACGLFFTIYFFIVRWLKSSGRYVPLQ